MNPTEALQKTETRSAKKAFSPRTDIYETDEARRIPVAGGK